jgi:hypothetical protein
MPGFVFTNAKGRVVELYHRAAANEGEIQAIALLSAQLPDDQTLATADTVASLLSESGAQEATNDGYSRQTVTPRPLVINEELQWVTLHTDDITFSEVEAAPGPWGKIILTYVPPKGDDTTSIPLLAYDFGITPDGSDLQAIVTEQGIFEAR